MFDTGITCSPCDRWVEEVGGRWVSYDELEVNDETTDSDFFVVCDTLELQWLAYADTTDLSQRSVYRTHV